MDHAFGLLMCLLGGLGIGLAVVAAPPGGFDPLPANQKQEYRFNLNANFYADQADWKADMGRLSTLIDRLSAYRGQLLSSPQNLLAALKLYKDYEDLEVKLMAYGEFRVAVDTSDRKAYDAIDQLRAEGNAKTSFMKVELRHLTPEKLAAFTEQAPGLQAYHYILDGFMRQAPYTLSEGKESVLAQFGPDLTSWQPALFQLMFDRAHFPEIEADGRRLDVHRYYETLMRNPDRLVRERAFRDYYEELDRLSDVVGFALYREMKALNDEAKLRGFKTYYNESLFDEYLSRTEMDNIYGQLEAHLALYHDYQYFRMAQEKKDLHVKQAEIWDMDIPPRGLAQPRFTADEAVGLVEKSLAVLGPEYEKDVKALLAPGSGRIDIVGGPGRQQGAFTEGDFGFFQDSFQGYLDDVSTLAHETGHAVHYRLVRDHRGALLFADGPSYMTESFAIFNEYLLRNYLLTHSKDEAVKKAVRQDTVKEMMNLWELARRAKFEMTAYDRVAKGEITGAEGFDKACEDTGLKYDLWFKKYPELKVHWIRKHHYWDVPTYYYNYVIAQMLALKYYQLYQADPENFAAKYVNMIENGFTAPASDLLKEYLGIDLKKPAFLSGTFELISRNFEALKAQEASRK
ncbi:MAG: M3 family metallopeptidase [Acidobacteriota bacterium]|jgi:oligoendopeptidase F